MQKAMNQRPATELHRSSSPSSSSCIHHNKYTLIIISSILKQEKAFKKMQIMHYNVSYSSQHQLPYMHVIHKPKDPGLVVRCLLKENNRSEGKEMVREEKQ
jgi:hypothetical protein